MRFVPCAVTPGGAARRWNRSPTDNKSQVNSGQAVVPQSRPSSPLLGASVGVLLQEMDSLKNVSLEHIYFGIKEITKRPVRMYLCNGTIKRVCKVLEDTLKHTFPLKVAIGLAVNRVITVCMLGRHLCSL